MLFDRLTNILKANLNDSYDKISDIFDGKKKDEDVKYEPYTPNTSHTQQSQSYTNTYEQQQRAQELRQQEELRKKEKGYYDALELSFGASFEEIKKAYRRLMKKYHPDLYPEPEKHKTAQQVSRRINEAYGYFEKKFGK